MPFPLNERFLIARTRNAIDLADDGLVGLLAMRRKLAHAAFRLKSRAGLALGDVEREHQVHTRGKTLAAKLGLPAATAERALALAIDDAREQQGLAPASGEPDAVECAAAQAPSPYLLRLLPPPQRLAPIVHALLPVNRQRKWLERALARVLAAPLRDGSLDFMAGRRLGVEVQDLRLRWVFELRDGQLRTVDGEPEACVRGSATDLLLLAGRLEDADSLFFQRALVLTGDTELGLTVRNLLERLPWEQVPLGLRIALNRGARLSRAARAAHRRQAA